MWEFSQHPVNRTHLTVTLVSSLSTHIPQVEGNFQIVPEVVCELRVHVQHLQNIFSEYLVQVAVGQSSHISVGLTRPGVQVDWFSKDVVLPCRMFAVHTETMHRPNVRYISKSAFPL